MNVKDNFSSVIRREIHPAISIPGTGSRSDLAAGRGVTGAVVDFVSSDETLDRYGEILVARGWRLENYRKNPVVQNAHNYGDIIFTIGRALVTEVRGNELFQRIEFATEVNPVARIAYGLYKGGFLNAVSVGFIPMQWETGGAEAGFRRKCVEQELVEVSAVGIPANPNALQLALAAGAVERNDLEEAVGRLEELVKRGEERGEKGEDAEMRRQMGNGKWQMADGKWQKSKEDFCSQQADLSADTGALGRGVLGAPWEQVTQLLKEIRAGLRRA